MHLHIYVYVIKHARAHTHTHTHTYVCCCYLVAKLCLTLLQLHPKQEYWSGLPFLSPGDHSNLGIETMSPA